MKKRIGFFAAAIGMAVLILYAAQPKIGSEYAVTLPSSTHATGTVPIWNGTDWIDGTNAAAVGGGSGDFSGPASSTNNNLVSFNGAGGKTGKDSKIATDGNGAITTTGAITAASFGTSAATAGFLLLGDGGTHTARITTQTMTGNANIQLDTAAGTGFWLGTASGTNEPITHVAGSGSGNVARVTGATVNNMASGNPTITFPVINYAYLTTNNTSFGFYMTGVTNSSGSTISQWAAVYIKSDGSIDLADANGSSTYPSWGLAAASINNGATGTIITMGNVRNDSWSFTPGATVWLSTTAGSLTTTQPSTTGDKIQAIGKALTATQLLLRPSQDYGTAP